MHTGETKRCGRGGRANKRRVTDEITDVSGGCKCMGRVGFLKKELGKCVSPLLHQKMSKSEIPVFESH